MLLASSVLEGLHDGDHKKILHRHRGNRYVDRCAGFGGAEKKPAAKKQDPSVALLSPTPVSRWSGSYVGLNGGAVCDHATAERGSFATTVGAADPQGFVDFTDRINSLGQYPNFLGGIKCGAIGGAQIGYNVLTGNIVWGGEADLQVTSIKRTDMRAFPAATIGAGSFAANTEQASQQMKLFGTVRARVGFLATPEFLVYATGGFAYAALDNGLSTTGIPSAFPGVTVSTTETGLTPGWTAGGGFEWLLGGLWTAKLEYLYYRFKDTVSLNYVSLPGGTGTSINYDFKNDGHIVRFGLNYKFGQ